MSTSTWRRGSDHGTLRLKENGQWLEIAVDASMNRRTDVQAERWDRCIGAYDRALAKRERNFDRNVTRRAQRYYAQHADIRLTSWKKANPRMSEVEAAMDLDPWHAYAIQNRPRFVLQADTVQQEAYASIATTFDLDGFGIYNIDRIMKMQPQQNVLASTADDQGRPFPWVRAYAVLKNENSVITYWSEGGGTRDVMLVSPGKMKALFLVAGDGTIARCDVAPLNSGEPSAELHYAIIEQPGSIEELKETASR